MPFDFDAMAGWVAPPTDFMTSGAVSGSNVLIKTLSFSLSKCVCVCVSQWVVLIMNRALCYQSSIVLH